MEWLGTPKHKQQSIFQRGKYLAGTAQFWKLMQETNADLQANTSQTQEPSDTCVR